MCTQPWSKNVRRERLVSPSSLLCEGLRSWVPEMETAWGVGDNSQKDVLGAPKALRLPDSSKEPS